MSWVEARLEPGSTPADLYEWMDEQPYDFHHFWDEPWWPGAFVVRVNGGQADLESCPAVSHLALWDERPDELLYGSYHQWAFEFFRASSLLSTQGDDRMTVKLVHCVLNARGLSVVEEARWALRFCRERMRMRWRIWRES